MINILAEIIQNEKYSYLKKIRKLKAKNKYMVTYKYHAISLQIRYTWKLYYSY